MQWEPISPDTSRARVEGGWLVKHHEQYVIKPPPKVVGSTAPTIGVNMSMVFIPDPDHKWVVIQHVQT